MMNTRVEKTTLRRLREAGRCGWIGVLCWLLFPGAAAVRAAEIRLQLGDFEREVRAVRFEDAVLRHPAVCAFLWGEEKETFQPSDEGLSIVPVRLTAKRAGRLALTPELFLMAERGRWHLCHGVRVVEPKPACGEAFFPPSGGSDLLAYSLVVEAGQTVLVDLVFVGERAGSGRLLAAMRFGGG